MAVSPEQMKVLVCQRGLTGPLPGAVWKRLHSGPGFGAETVVFLY